LSEEEKNKMEDPLTVDECYEIIKTFKSNKSPGNDGISAEFYKKFWPIFGRYMVESFTESFIKGELTDSQKQAVITLIDKNKDRSLLKNWRPISLLNVDYKILTKTLSRRLVDILPNIIHINQTGFIKNRYIGQNIRAVIDILHYTKEENMPGILLAIDFEKAYDSVEWLFIQMVLKKFNFGVNFQRWVALSYQNASSCTINKGVTSEYFNLERGVRQGDPLSPYIFTLCVELLACKIRQDNAIKGIQVLGEEVKVLQYADDTNGLVADIKSAKAFLDTISEFGIYSGLKINKEKSEAMWLGSLRDSIKKPLGIKWTNEPMKILGIYVSYDCSANYEKNTKDRLKDMKTLINIWKIRNLTLLGKIQIIKTFLISKFQYYMSINHLTDDTMNEIKKLLFNFIWNGTNDKIKRDVLVDDIKNGGLNAPHLESILLTSRVAWVRRYLFAEDGIWKKLWIYNMKKIVVNLDLLLYCDYDNTSLKYEKKSQYVNQFYFEILNAWKALQNQKVREDVSMQYIWFNKTIKIN
jgi:hypothetical protein